MKDKIGNELLEGDVLYSKSSPHYTVKIKRIDSHDGIILEENYDQPGFSRKFRLNERQLLCSGWRKQVKTNKAKPISRSKQPSRMFDPETMAWV